MLVLYSPSDQGRYGCGSQSPHHLQRRYQKEGLCLFEDTVVSFVVDNDRLLLRRYTMNSTGDRLPFGGANSGVKYCA